MDAAHSVGVRSASSGRGLPVHATLCTCACSSTASRGATAATSPAPAVRSASTDCCTRHSSCWQGCIGGGSSGGCSRRCCEHGAAADAGWSTILLDPAVRAAKPPVLGLGYRPVQGAFCVINWRDANLYHLQEEDDQKQQGAARAAKAARKAKRKQQRSGKGHDDATAGGRQQSSASAEPETAVEAAAATPAADDAMLEPHTSPAQPKAAVPSAYGTADSAEAAAQHAAPPAWQLCPMSKVGRGCTQQCSRLG